MNKIKCLKITLILVATLNLLACQPPPLADIAADDYFPLAVGHHWHYRTTLWRGDQRQRGEYRVRNLGQVTRGVDEYWARVNNHGTEYLFGHDERGIYRVGVRSIVADEVQLDERPRYVLKFPYRKNSFWFANSHAFVIERTQPVRERFWNSHAFEMEYQIIGLDETVDTPAGTFEHCLRVEATGLVQILADVTQGRYGSAEGEITTTEWYAPGVGLVKLHRQEVFANDLFVDGSYSVELLDSSAIKAGS